MKTQSSFRGLPLPARCTIVLFCAGGLLALLYAAATQPGFDPARFLLLLTLAAGTARLKVNLFKGSTLSFLTSVVLVAVIKEGAAVSILVGVCGVTVQTLVPSKKIVLHQLLFNAGMIALTVTGSWWTYHLLAQSPNVDALTGEITATVLASFTYFLGNSISVSLIVALTKGMSIFSVWFNHFLFAAPSFLIAGLLSLGVIALTGSLSFSLAAALLMSISVAYFCSIRITAQTVQ